MAMEELKEKQSFVQKTNPEPDTLESLERALEQLSGRVKTLAKKNGFSKELKKKVELELN